MGPSSVALRAFNAVSMWMVWFMSLPLAARHCGTVSLITTCCSSGSVFITLNSAL
jgi:hypothetical protein